MNFLSKLHAEMLGCNMQRLIKERELKVDDVCAGLHICRSNYYRIIRCEKEVSHDDARKIAEYFSLSVEEMVRPVSVNVSFDVDADRVTRETAKQAKEVLSVYLNSLENIDEWAEESNEITHIVIDSARFIKE